MGDDNTVSKFGSESVLQEMERIYPGLEAEIENVNAEMLKKLDTIIDETTEKFCDAVKKRRQIQAGEWALFRMWVVSVVHKYGVDCFEKAINETITVIKEVGE